MAKAGSKKAEAEADGQERPDICEKCDAHVFLTVEGYRIDQALVPDGEWLLLTTPDGQSVVPKPSNMQAGYHMHKHQAEGVTLPSLPSKKGEAE